MKQVKRILTQKPEPLLLVVPLVLLAVIKIFISDPVVNLNGQENEGLQLDSSILFWIVFAFIAIPFILHLLLRASGKWDAVFCRPHVYLTISLLLLMFISFYGNSQPVRLQNIPRSTGGKFMDAFNFNRSFGWIYYIELMVQLLFTLYFLIRIFQKESKYLRTKPPVHSSL